MNLQKQMIVALGSASILLFSCGQTTQEKSAKAAETAAETVVKAPVYDASNPQSVLQSVAYAQGGWDDLYNKKDVEYIYNYSYPDGKKDVSVERYIFANEASFGSYSQNDITMPEAKGKLAQYFDGKKAFVMVDGKKLEDPIASGGADFLRRANYFWFAMPYKLNNDEANLKSMGQEEHNGVTYDKIAVSYDPSVTGKEQNDSYILYVNPGTKLIDRFLFSLPALGVTVPAIVGNYEYEDIKGQMVATKRTYFMPNAQGEYADSPSIIQTLSDVKFNNGFTADNIMQ